MVPNLSGGEWKLENIRVYEPLVDPEPFIGAMKIRSDKGELFLIELVPRERGRLIFKRGCWLHDGKTIPYKVPIRFLPRAVKRIVREAYPLLGLMYD